MSFAFSMRTTSLLERKVKMIHSHFAAAFVFALITSVVFAVTTKDNDRERVLYGLWVFSVFVVVSFALAWLMYLGQR